jgi:hypothetical protein
VAASSGESLSRAERSVAFGEAAPETSAAVAVATGRGGATGQGETTAKRPPPPAGSDRPDRRRIYAGALALIAVAVVVIVVVVASGGSKPRATPASANAPAPAAAGTAGIVPGRSIQLVSIGDARDQVHSTLIAHGYAPRPGSVPTEDDYFSSKSGTLVVDFDQGKVILLQKYNDATIKVSGVSVASTLRQAEAALPSWHAVRCPTRLTLLIAPDARTYFELPHDLNQGNQLGFNGIAVSASTVDQRFC